jgi:hypothetical protein
MRFRSRPDISRRHREPEGRQLRVHRHSEGEEDAQSGRSRVGAGRSSTRRRAVMRTARKRRAERERLHPLLALVGNRCRGWRVLPVSPQKVQEATHAKTHNSVCIWVKASSQSHMNEVSIAAEQNCRGIIHAVGDTAERLSWMVGDEEQLSSGPLRPGDPTPLASGRDAAADYATPAPQRWSGHGAGSTRHPLRLSRCDDVRRDERAVHRN